MLASRHFSMRVFKILVLSQYWLPKRPQKQHFVQNWVFKLSSRLYLRLSKGLLLVFPTKRNKIGRRYEKKKYYRKFL